MKKNRTKNNKKILEGVEVVSNAKDATEVFWSILKVIFQSTFGAAVLSGCTSLFGYIRSFVLTFLVSAGMIPENVKIYFENHHWGFAGVVFLCVTLVLALIIGLYNIYSHTSKGAYRISRSLSKRAARRLEISESVSNKIRMLKSKKYGIKYRRSKKKESPDELCAVGFGLLNLYVSLLEEKYADITKKKRKTIRGAFEGFTLDRIINKSESLWEGYIFSYAAKHDTKSYNDFIGTCTKISWIIASEYKRLQSYYNTAEKQSLNHYWKKYGKDDDNKKIETSSAGAIAIAICEKIRDREKSYNVAINSKNKGMGRTNIADLVVKNMVLSCIGSVVYGLWGEYEFPVFLDDEDIRKIAECNDFEKYICEKISEEFVLAERDDGYIDNLVASEAMFQNNVYIIDNFNNVDESVISDFFSDFGANKAEKLVLTTYKEQGLKELTDKTLRGCLVCTIESICVDDIEERVESINADKSNKKDLIKAASTSLRSYKFITKGLERIEREENSGENSETVDDQLKKLIGQTSAETERLDEGSYKKYKNSVNDELELQAVLPSKSEKPQKEHTNDEQPMKAIQNIEKLSIDYGNPSGPDTENNDSKHASGIDELGKSDRSVKELKSTGKSEEDETAPDNSKSEDTNSSNSGIENKTSVRNIPKVSEVKPVNDEYKNIEPGEQPDIEEEYAIEDVSLDNEARSENYLTKEASGQRASDYDLIVDDEVESTLNEATDAAMVGEVEKAKDIVLKAYESTERKKEFLERLREKNSSMYRAVFTEEHNGKIIMSHKAYLELNEEIEALEIMKDFIRNHSVNNYNSDKKKPHEDEDK